MKEQTSFLTGNEAEASPSPRMQQNVENDEKDSGKLKKVAGNVATGIGGAILGGTIMSLTKDGPQIPDVVNPKVVKPIHHAPKAKVVNTVEQPAAQPVEQPVAQEAVEKSPIVIEIHHVTDKPVVDLDTADSGEAPVEHFTIDPSVNPVFAVAHSTDIPINAINVPGNLYPTEPTEYYTYEEHVHVHLDNHDDISS